MRVMRILFLIAAILVLVFLWFRPRNPSKKFDGPTQSDLTLEEIPFDGASAMRHLESLCALGRRPSGSEGMKRQQEIIADHFRRHGGRVHLQRFEAQHPEEDRPVAMANLIGQWFPEREDRLLLCAHYDTLPYPMLDLSEPRGRFIGANDGASGTAVLMQLAESLSDLLEKKQTHYGVDLVLFDGEEFIFSRGDRYFLGSEFFARQYADGLFPPTGRYHQGVLLDMIGDADLQIYQEVNSMWWDDTRPLVEEIWSLARELGVYEFIPVQKHEIRDDHLPLHNIGGISCCNVIDFDYPPWHTTEDVPEQCSALSLGKVGWVIREWLVRKKPPEGV